jgi:hypothetical protein
MLSPCRGEGVFPGEVASLEPGLPRTVIGAAQGVGEVTPVRLVVPTDGPDVWSNLEVQRSQWARAGSRDDSRGEFDDGPWPALGRRTEGAVFPGEQHGLLGILRRIVDGDPGMAWFNGRPVPR